MLCGRNAECSSKHHQTVCTCKHGYYGNSKDEKIGCRRVECESHKQCSLDKLCDQYTCKIACLVHNPCGKNTLCSSETHKQVCYCQPGYTGDPLRDCEIIDFCADDPCGPDADCQNTRGSFKCQCPNGTVGDPYNEGCRVPVECETDYDCPLSAKCDKSNGLTKCKDVCLYTICGPNADCIAIDHVGHCSCRNGYEGNPQDSIIGCRPKPVSCRSISDCPSNTYCYTGVCIRKLQNA